MSRTRQLAVLVAIPIAVLSLAACSDVPEDVVKSSAQQVEIETRLTGTDVAYVDNGNRTEMPKCKDKSFWGPNCYESSDQSIRITYHKSKSGYGSEEITVDGQSYAARCITSWSGPVKCWHDGEKIESGND